MPELSEVEHFRRLLLPLVCPPKKFPNPHLALPPGKNHPASSFLSVECPSPTPPKSFPASDEIHCLSEYRLTDVLRKGKLLRLDLIRPKTVTAKPKIKWLFLHMGMTGRISTPETVVKLESLSGDDEYPPPHTHLVLKSNGREAAFSDPRRFGKVRICGPPDDEFDDLAPDALDEPGKLDGIVGQRKGIKALLLDQRAVVSGIGNWIADEVLYQTGMHPDQTYLTSNERDKLRERLCSVLKTSVTCLSSGKDFPDDWIFHRRWSKGSSKVGTIKDARGRKITWQQSGGRTSAIVPSFQKIKSRKAAKGKPAKKKSKTKDEENAGSVALDERSADRADEVPTPKKGKSSAMKNKPRKRKSSAQKTKLKKRQRVTKDKEGSSHVFPGDGPGDGADSTPIPEKRKTAGDLSKPVKTATRRSQRRK